MSTQNRLRILLAHGVQAHIACGHLYAWDVYTLNGETHRKLVCLDHVDLRNWLGY